MVEGGGLENRYGAYVPSGVRIPPSPLSVVRSTRWRRLTLLTAAAFALLATPAGAAEWRQNAPRGPALTWPATAVDVSRLPGARERVAAPIGDGPGAYAVQSGTAYRTLDGATWTRLAASPVEFPTEVAAPAAAPDTVWLVRSGGVLLKSTDAAATWRALANPFGSGGVHLVLDAANPDRAWASSLQGLGVRRTVDGGAHWTAVGVPAGVYPLTLTADPRGGGTLLATGDGGLLRSADGGDHWTTRTFGNPRDVAFLGDGVVLVTVGSDVHRSLDAGVTFATAEAGLPRLHPLELGPAAGRRAIGRVGVRMYETVDAGATWRMLPPGPDVQPLGTIALAASDVQLLAATEDGVFRQPLGGGPWRRARGLPVGASVSDVAARGRRAFAIVHGYGVYGSSDGGIRWRRISNRGAANGIAIAVNSHGVHLLDGAVVRSTRNKLAFARQDTVANVFDLEAAGDDVLAIGASVWRRHKDGGYKLRGEGKLAAAIDPADPRHVVGLGFDDDGVFESRDAGRSWRRCLKTNENVTAAIGRDGRIVVAGPHSYVLGRNCRIVRRLPGIEDGASGPMLVRRDAIHLVSDGLLTLRGRH